MDPRIATVIARMEAGLADHLTIGGLAVAVNLSASRLAHLFTKETGMAPARYLHHLRMQRARLLLERTFLSVKQVMTCVGVNDPSHFARDFRRFHGVPPSALRRRRSAADAGRRRDACVPRTAGEDGASPSAAVTPAADGDPCEWQPLRTPGEKNP